MGDQVKAGEVETTFLNSQKRGMTQILLEEVVKKITGGKKK